MDVMITLLWMGMKLGHVSGMELGLALNPYVVSVQHFATRDLEWTIKNACNHAL